MSRDRKTLLVILVPVLAFAVYAASNAFAANITAGKYVATVSGTTSNINVLKIGTGVREISCASTAIGGSLSAASETISLSGEGNVCSSKPEVMPVTGTTNGCTIKAKFTSVSGTTATATTTVECPAEKQLEIRVYVNATTHGESSALCEYGIPPQGPLSTLETHNTGSGSSEDILATASIKEIKVNVLKGTLLNCGAAAGKSTTATYTGELTATATEEAEAQTGVMVG